MNRTEKIDFIKEKPPFNRADIIVFTVVVVIVALVMLAVFKDDGAFVTVTTPSATYTYPLSADAVIDVDGHLTVVIKNGAVAVEKADCPDKLCVHSGAKSKSGEIIACLPNGIVITISGVPDIITV